MPWRRDAARPGAAGGAVVAVLAANRNSIHPSFYVYSMYIGAELSRNRRENILYTKVLRALLLTGSIHK